MESGSHGGSPANTNVAVDECARRVPTLYKPVQHVFVDAGGVVVACVRHVVPEGAEMVVGAQRHAELLSEQLLDLRLLQIADCALRAEQLAGRQNSCPHIQFVWTVRTLDTVPTSPDGTLDTISRGKC